MLTQKTMRLPLQPPILKNAESADVLFVMDGLWTFTTSPKQRALEQMMRGLYPSAVVVIFKPMPTPKNGSGKTE